MKLADGVLFSPPFSTFLLASSAAVPFPQRGGRQLARLKQQQQHPRPLTLCIQEEGKKKKKENERIHIIRWALD